MGHSDVPGAVSYIFYITYPTADSKLERISVPPPATFRHLRKRPVSGIVFWRRWLITATLRGIPLAVVGANAVVGPFFGGWGGGTDDLFKVLLTEISEEKK